MEPYSLRHGEASHDAQTGDRSSAQIKAFGRWRAGGLQWSAPQTGDATSAAHLHARSHDAHSRADRRTFAPGRLRTTSTDEGDFFWFAEPNCTRRPQVHTVAQQGYRDQYCRQTINSCCETAQKSVDSTVEKLLCMTLPNMGNLWVKWRSDVSVSAHLADTDHMRRGVSVGCATQQMLPRGQAVDFVVSECLRPTGTVVHILVFVLSGDDEKESWRALIVLQSGHPWQCNGGTSFIYLPSGLKQRDNARTTTMTWYDSECAERSKEMRQT